METTQARFEGQRLLILGFGSIAATVLPMLLRHIAIRPEQILVLARETDHAKICARYGIERRESALTPENFREVLGELLGAGDCLLNLTGGISSPDLVRFCLRRGIDYFDTSNERWDHGSGQSQDTDFAEDWSELIGMRPHLPRRATALVSHGANPGLVSHFAKQAVEDLARAEGIAPDGPPTGWDWGALARELGIETLHISERDTQEPAAEPAEDEIVNTWSVESMIEESNATPCFAWGSHEARVDGVELRRDPVSMVALYPGPAHRCIARSWLPSFGEFEGAVIPHEEAFSIAELFTDDPDDRSRYQPTVLFAYRPCDAVHEAINSEDPPEDPTTRVLIEEIARGTDELGILVLRKGTRRVYWYGSILDVREARRRERFSNATSLQVAAGVVGGLVWLLENPGRGLVSAEHADHTRVLEIARPYLGRLGGIRGVWRNAPTRWLSAELIEPEGAETSAP